MIGKLNDIEMKRKFLETRYNTWLKFWRKGRVGSAPSANKIYEQKKRRERKLGSRVTLVERSDIFLVTQSCGPAKAKKCAMCPRHGHFAVCCEDSESRRRVDRYTNQGGVCSGRTILSIVMKAIQHLHGSGETEGAVYMVSISVEPVTASLRNEGFVMKRTFRKVERVRFQGVD